MAIDASQLARYVIRPTLKRLGLHSTAAEKLLLGTAAQESRLGTYLHQLGGGPAKGIFQMEPATHDDIWHNYLQYKQPLADEIRHIAGVNEDEVPSADLMVTNLAYAAAMARAHYLRVPEALPNAADIGGLAGYWKRYYNTFLGRGTEEEFSRNYHRYVLGG